MVSVAELDHGVIAARVRTTNILYERRGLVEKSSFGAPGRVSLHQLWVWRGASWGGLPDGISIVTKLGNPAEPGD